MITLQKVAPLGVASSVVRIEELGYLMGVAVLNGVLGSWGGLNQTQLRPIIGYSSVVHLG